MVEKYQFDVFKTPWGWFGVMGNELGLVRTNLPVAHKEAVHSRMLSGIHNAERSKKAFSLLKKAICSYYKGDQVDFDGVKLQLVGLSDFQQTVLTTLRSVTYGRIVSYSQLAKSAGNPKAARAIGAVLAQNPLPLIIPCHRVIKADGSVGQFSAAGGTDTKRRMLKLENTRSR
jgi:O-6-methylguanine DNA methyltransferase